MNLKAALDVLVASAEMDAKSLMSKTGEQTPASDALWTIAAKLRKLSAQAASTPDLPAAKEPLSGELDPGAAAARALVEALKTRGVSGSIRDVDGFRVEVTKLKPQPADLPPPFDSQEEAQRAAGIWPQEAEPATVRVKPSALDEMAARTAIWVSKAASERVIGASPALGAPYGIDATLAERGSRYGKFEDHSEVSQALKKVVFTKRPRETLAADQVEALEMICHKLGRIVNGDPDYADSWLDIAGYAKLVADRLEGVSR